uniref:Uncharacterized protein n=1 Tax=Eutreptiella gymnastica TaxID=73025 RepID=A0A7S4GBQ9_9EUGL
MPRSETNGRYICGDIIQRSSTTGRVFHREQTPNLLLQLSHQRQPQKMRFLIHSARRSSLRGQLHGGCMPTMQHCAAPHPQGCTVLHKQQTPQFLLSQTKMS